MGVDKRRQGCRSGPKSGGGGEGRGEDSHLTFHGVRGNAPGKN